MSTALEIALAAAPTDRAHNDTIARRAADALAAQQPTTTADSRFAALVEQVTDALAEGDAVPADVAAGMLALEREEELARLRRGALQTVERNYRNANDLALVDAHLGPIFANLGEQLEQLMIGISDAVVSLGSATTAEQVLADGTPAAVEAWQALPALAEKYDDIRVAQRSLYQDRVSGRGLETMTRAGLFRNSIDVLSHWATRRHESANKSNPEGPEASTHKVWLREALPIDRAVDLDDGWWPEAQTRVEHLVWIVRFAKPWVPLPSTVQRVNSRIATLVQPLNGPMNSTLVEARSELVALTSAN